MGFYHQAGIIYRAAPFVARTFALFRVHQFFTLAKLAFETGHPYWGWRFAGNALHYVQDLTQPCHASLLPGVSTPRMLFINSLAVLGWSPMKNDTIVLVSNRHFALERYQVQMLYRAFADGEAAPIVKALQSSETDATYPAWSDSYVRDTVSAEAFAAGDRIDATLAAAVPANYVADPRYDFGAQGGGVDLFGEIQQGQAARRSELDSVIADLLRHFGAHSRNLIRAPTTNDARRHGDS